MRIALLSVLCLPLPLLAASALAQDALRPDAKPFRVVEGRGVQIYTCTSESWTFTAPEAELYDRSAKVGSHAAGPTWTWQDGSSIRGKLVSSTPAPQPTANIPWLLLSTTTNGDNNGELAGTRFVRRTETTGGIAPATGCDASHAGATVRVPYTARYAFYR